MTTARLDQIAEAAADLEAAFADPSHFHSPGSPDRRPVQDHATSLLSEFVGAYRDDHVTYRLGQLVAAEDAGRPREARRHLVFVRRRVAARLTQWSAAAKDQVAESPDCRVSPSPPVVADGARPTVTVGS